MLLISPGRSYQNAELLKSKLKNKGKVIDLSTEGQALFGLLCLIVDIKYKNKYGKSLEWKDGRGYAMNTNSTNETIK
jgi:hypothetical protein